MKILVIGGGGRCHAICEKLKNSPKNPQIYCAPGNAGMANIATLVPIGDSEIEKLLQFALDEKIDMTVVGPEIPLSMGIVDLFESHNLAVFGPRKNAAKIEWSKEFAKDLMAKYDIPTAEYAVFEDYEPLAQYIEKVGVPIVLKFDGLAYGKGVVVCDTIELARESAVKMLKDRVFGAGKVVCEECLIGPEFSFMCLVNDEIVLPLDIAQDHKRELDGDKGENTGGMGAYSGVPFITKEDVDYTFSEIMVKTVQALKAEGAPFKGVLYGGLMKTPKGIKVIEFNARFGDPETEVVLPRMKSDLVEVLENLLEGKKSELEFYEEVTVGVVLASKNYPRNYEKGFEISGLENVEIPVYHMGTKLEDGVLKTNGGRVLFAVAKGKTFKEAQQNCYKEIAKIQCENLFCRKDIAWQVINFQNENL
ncbi:MAG: phosphoribosylamine--glycine ligase [Bacillota bacterium]